MSLTSGGSPPFQVTNFQTGLIFNFAYSPDGRQLALARGAFERDSRVYQEFLIRYEHDRVSVPPFFKAAGPGLEFRELGMCSFDGIDGDWRLFTVVR